MANLPGTRIRSNNIFGSITDNPLTAGAALFNSPSLADMPAVTAGNHLIVTLDPLRQYGFPEIVMVTAHTASATVASIQRGMYGTTARTHPQNTFWAHAAVTNDFIEIVTSVTRPSDPYRGQTIFETDTDRIVTRDSSNTNWVRTGWTTANGRTGVRLRRVANQSIPNNGGAPTPIIWDTEDFDSDNFIGPSSTTATIPAGLGGVYTISVVIALQSAAVFGGRSFIDIQAGATTWRCPIVPSFEGLTTASVTTALAAADALSIALFQTSGGAVNVGPQTKLEVYRIGA